MPKLVYSRRPIGRGGKLWEATPKQREFLLATEDEVLFGGAVGGGKSDSLLIFSLLRRQTIPGSRGLILRRTYPELERSLIMRALELLQGTGVHYQAQHHRFLFPNGSVQEFGYLETDADVYKYQSAQYEDICWDELTEHTEFRYRFMLSRLRTTIPGVRCVVRAATNPGNVGHAWVRARFVDVAPPNTPFTDPETGLTRRYIPATLDDNPHIDRESYERRLMDLPEAQRRALRYGDWDVFEGQYFREFRRTDEHGRPWHVIPVQKVPDDWKRWRALDWGYTQPACCLWFAKSPEGKVWVYRELYVTGLTAESLAERILDLSGDEDIHLTLADPSLWAKTGHEGVSIEEAMRRAGLRLTKSDNDRIAGWQRVHEALAEQEWDDGTVSPRLQIMENCVNLIRTLPQMVHDPTRPEDLDTDGEDHAVDALRYGLAVHLSPPVPEDVRRARELRRKRLLKPVVSRITGY